VERWNVDRMHQSRNLPRQLSLPGTVDEIVHILWKVEVFTNRLAVC
jgi:hypothetical protein